MSRFAFTPRNLIQAPDIGRKIAQAFGLKERVPVTTIVPEIQPVIIVGNFPNEQVEDLEIERPWVDALSTNFAAGDVATTFEIFNPPTSSVILEFIRINAAYTGTVTATSTLHFTNAQNPYDFGGTPHSRHTGITFTGSSAAQDGGNLNRLAAVNGGSGQVIHLRHPTGGSTIEMLQGERFFITPGFGLRLQITGFGTGGSHAMSASWRERRIKA